MHLYFPAYKRNYVSGKNKALFDITTQNFSILGITNVISICTDSISFLSQEEKVFDWLYADPARRDDARKKVFLLEECEPDLGKNLPLLFSRAKNILIKASPMLDISRAIRELEHKVAEIHIVAVKNDCKELLLVCRDRISEPRIHCINIGNNRTEEFTFSGKEEEKCDVIYTSVPEKYLYEPNVALLKSGAFKLAGCRFGLKKFHANTHLYTGQELVPEFPGRVFHIKQVFPSFNELKRFLPQEKANLTVRNFPFQVHEIRKKYKIKEGGDMYVFACTMADNTKRILLCEKVT